MRCPLPRSSVSRRSPSSVASFTASLALWTLEIQSTCHIADAAEQANVKIPKQSHRNANPKNRVCRTKDGSSGDHFFLSLAHSLVSLFDTVLWNQLLLLRNSRATMEQTRWLWKSAWFPTQRLVTMKGIMTTRTELRPCCWIPSQPNAPHQFSATTSLAPTELDPNSSQQLI